MGSFSMAASRPRTSSVNSFSDTVRVEAQNRHSGSSMRRESQNVGEIKIQRDQAAPLGSADLKQVFIIGAGEPLLRDGLHLMAARDDQFRGAGTEVLVEFEFHAAL